MVCYDCLFCLCGELVEYHSRLGSGLKIVFGGNALYFGSVQILEHRGGHWSDLMKSFSAPSSRTLNPLSRGCERHVDCVLAVL